MDLKEALEIAIDELADAVQQHRATHKGYMKKSEKYCRQLLTARNVLIGEVEKTEVKKMISQFMGRPVEYWLNIEKELDELKNKNNKPLIELNCDLIPSNELRFVKREILSNPMLITTVNILQQKWYEKRHSDINYAEPPAYIWIDVPVENEK